jgi:hypothetical protein
MFAGSAPWWNIPETSIYLVLSMHLGGSRTGDRTQIHPPFVEYPGESEGFVILWILAPLMIFPDRTHNARATPPVHPAFVGYPGESEGSVIWWILAPLIILPDRTHNARGGISIRRSDLPDSIALISPRGGTVRFNSLTADDRMYKAWTFATRCLHKW